MRKNEMGISGSVLPIKSNNYICRYRIYACILLVYLLDIVHGDKKLWL
jgi:hypothetical protein